MKRRMNPVKPIRIDCDRRRQQAQAVDNLIIEGNLFTRLISLKSETKIKEQRHDPIRLNYSERMENPIKTGENRPNSVRPDKNPVKPIKNQ